MNGFGKAISIAGFVLVGSAGIAASAMAAPAASTIQGGSFSQQSGSVNVDCEQWGTAVATITLPSNVTILTSSARWIDLSNIKNSSTDAIVKNGNTLTVTGGIRGLDKQWNFGIANCPGGGHGTLEISGTYR